MRELSTISFVIPTYNAKAHIERCLKNLRGQDYPQEKIEILIVDGASTDNTLEIAKKYNCRILANPKRLAEYGLQIGVRESKGEFLVPFAADNGLVGRDWVKRVTGLFSQDKELSAAWGRLVSGKDDSSLNKYFELIQSDPLSWFLNRNLEKYKRSTQVLGGNCFMFKVDPRVPLVWGANGLVYRAARAKKIWDQEGYLGDNDAFQYMIAQGNNKVAYFNEPFVYHHHVANLRSWISKWKRNYKLHFLDKLKTRNLDWVFIPDFNLRVGLWLVYSLCPFFSGAHAFYLMFKQRNPYWFYHVPAAFLQTCVYIYITLATAKGRQLLKNLIKIRKDNSLCIF